MIMMVYYYLPFMFLPIYSSLERFNYCLIEASYDLGAHWLQTFRRIMLPLTSNGIVAGFFLVFIPSFGEFAIPELMGGDKKMFVGTVVSQYILGEGTGSLGAAFTLISGIILLASAILLFFVLNRILKPRSKQHETTGY
jgi:spermidine/putrescine transport system permease protein